MDYFKNNEIQKQQRDSHIQINDSNKIKIKIRTLLNPIRNIKKNKNILTLAPLIYQPGDIIDDKNIEKAFGQKKFVEEE